MNNSCETKKYSYICFVMYRECYTRFKLKV